MSREIFEPDRPFDELPRLPPASELETSSVLRACISASRKLGELKGLPETITGRGIFLRPLLIQESRSSSEVENIISTRDRLFFAASGNPETDIFTREIVRYNDAMERFSNTIPDMEVLRSICSEILEEDADYRSTHDDEVFLVSAGSRRHPRTPSPQSVASAGSWTPPRTGRRRQGYHTDAWRLYSATPCAPPR